MLLAGQAQTWVSYTHLKPSVCPDHLSLSDGPEQGQPGFSAPGDPPACLVREKPNPAAFSGPWASVWSHFPLDGKTPG